MQDSQQYANNHVSDPRSTVFDESIHGSYNDMSFLSAADILMACDKYSRFSSTRINIRLATQRTCISEIASDASCSSTD